MTQQPLMFYGWLVLGCAVLVLAVSNGTRMSFGIVLVPLSTQFDWTRTTLSTIVLISGTVGGLLQPVIGVLVDRVGPRRILGGGVVLLGLSLWLVTVSTTMWQFGLAYGLLGGLGFAAVTPVTGNTLTANWFIRHRGLAQSMVTSSLAAGWMLVVPENVFLERSHGWTTMYRVWGTAMLIALLPLIWAFVRNRPEEMGLRPYGDAVGGAPATTTTGTPMLGIPLREALRTFQTWQIVYLGFA
jgi:sugar phosphate permease